MLVLLFDTVPRGMQRFTMFHLYSSAAGNLLIAFLPPCQSIDYVSFQVGIFSRLDIHLENTLTSVPDVCCSIQAHSQSSSTLTKGLLCP